MATCESHRTTGASGDSTRLLVVSVHVPPAPSAVAFIVDNLSRQFTTEEMLIVGERNPGSDTYRRADNLPRIHHVGAEWTWPRRGRKYVRWARWFLVPLIVYRLNRWIKRYRPTAVLAFFPDERYLLAAYWSATRNRVRFYPYYQNTYLDNRRGLSRWLASWLQPRTFDAASLVFVMSEGMQRAWQARYPGVHFEPLVHTTSDEIPTFASPPAPGIPVRTAFLGNLNESNLDAMGRFRQVINDNPDYSLTIFSGSPAWFFEKVGVCGSTISHERVSDEELMDRLRAHDILLLPHGFSGGLSEIEYETIFPTRTIPYLMSGRPILAHAPAECFITRWLRKHDCAEIVDRPDAALLKNAFERLRSDPRRRDELVQNALRAVEYFRADSVAKRLRATLASAERKDVAATSASR